MCLSRLAVVLAPLILLTSCATVAIETKVPPVPTGETLLTQGRRVYLTSCARCHDPEPVTGYSRSQWNRILPEMIAEAKLSSRDAAAVTAYVRNFVP